MSETLHIDTRTGAEIDPWKRIARLERECEALRRDGRWIDTAVRLPCEGDTVLGFWNPMRGEVHGGCYGVATYYPGHWHNPDDDEDDYATPDRWMTLPKPPTLRATSAGAGTESSQERGQDEKNKG